MILEVSNNHTRKQIDSRVSGIKNAQISFEYDYYWK